MKEKGIKAEEKCVFCGNDRLSLSESKFAPFLVERMFAGKNVPVSLAVCPKCGIKYSSYRPNDEEMCRLYSGYRDENYQKQRQKYESNYTAEFNKALGEDNTRRERLNDYIQKYIKVSDIKTVLDYGGDKGQYIPECFNSAERCVFEISDLEPLQGIKQISTKESLFEKKYGFVMCCHVLEHVSYPQDILKELLELTKPDGYLYIEVPKEEPYGEIIHEHINNYSLKTLLSICYKYNLKLVHFEKSSYISVLINNKKASFLRNFITVNILKFQIGFTTVKKYCKRIKLIWEYLL